MAVIKLRLIRSRKAMMLSGSNREDHQCSKEKRKLISNHVVSKTFDGKNEI